MYIEAPVPIPMTTFLNIGCNSPYISIIYCGRGNGMERNGRRNSNTEFKHIWDGGEEGRKGRQGREGGRREGKEVIIAV